jgi:oxygen-independent coproporphyrinogen-3 oxidase
MEKLQETFGFDSGLDITTEANPDSVDEEYLRQLKDAGFTRVSIGMQSAVPKVLAVLERTHNPENVAIAIQAAKNVGLATSVDLIYGSPGESLEDWQQTLEAAIALDTDHISAYSLIVEPGTKLARQVKSGELVPATDDLHADMYELSEKLLSAAGFVNYEVSNWAKSVEQRSGHNMAYWKSMDWWGFGPGAHSHVGGVRWWNVKHPTTYISKLSSGESPMLENEVLTTEQLRFEEILLRIRLSSGLSLDFFTEPELAILNSYLAQGHLDEKAWQSGDLKLSITGRLLADQIVRALDN